jgi:drug/metabolite transporter (DMT)-like permease
MVIGAGLPFFMIGASGMQFAPASDIGALLPGTMSFFVAVGAKLVEREVFGRARSLGFSLIVVGVLIIAWGAITAGGGAWRGHLLFLFASATFAVYTFAFIRSGLKPFHAVGLVSAWSTVLAIPAWLLFSPPGLPEIDLGPFLALATIQGLFSGVAAIAAFAFAVQKIGPSKAAAYTALVPVVTALLGIAVLGEWPTPVGWLGSFVVSSGVLLASGAIDWRRLAARFRFVPKGEAG